jgi:hypothetical protein
VHLYTRFDTDGSQFGLPTGTMSYIPQGTRVLFHNEYGTAVSGHGPLTIAGTLEMLGSGSAVFQRQITRDATPHVNVLPSGVLKFSSYGNLVVYGAPELGVRSINVQGALVHSSQLPKTNIGQSFSPSLNMDVGVALNMSDGSRLLCMLRATLQSASR